METIIAIIPVFVVAFLLGFYHKEIRDLKKGILELTKKNEEAEKKKSYVTLGSYRPPQETKQSAHIINPKSPQRIEFEANQQTLAENNLIDRSAIPQ